MTTHITVGRFPPDYDIPDVSDPAPALCNACSGLGCGECCGTGVADPAQYTPAEPAQSTPCVDRLADALEADR